MRPERELIDSLATRYDFPLDRFQVEAIAAIDAQCHVIVAAPTGSGKTVVAEYGIEAALAAGQRAFYTAPIKALSNQKYRDLVGYHGSEQVGLLTGDNAVNGDAPIVVMTTEVLRNMMYAHRSLDQLGVVVLDEVHYLQDAYRGPVWEEVIIHLPEHVQLICLSATVSNVDELAEWMTAVRGSTSAVIEERRPVPLDHWYFVNDVTNDRLRFLPTLIGGRPNPDAMRLDAAGARAASRRRDRKHAPRGSDYRKLAPPGRLATIDELAARSMLPAVFFIFSRAQCDEAARNTVASGIRLTDADERSRIMEIVESRLGSLSSADLDVLGYDEFVRQLTCGVAAHHAGMVPPFKEVVESCFVEGLIKVVFATETLAVGVNMPARSVVIEKLTKWTGDRHEMLSPGQFTQLTGRAGRRGIDDHGNAVVLWSPFISFEQVAELALSRSFHLRSAFRPTYNMVANLVRTYDNARARQLLAVSFAQFQSDRDVVKLERRIQRRRAREAELRAEAASPFGDIDDYRRRVKSLNAATADVDGDDPLQAALLALKPGQLIRVRKGKYKGPAAVVATAARKQGIKVTVITASGQTLDLVGTDFDVAPMLVGKIVLPGNYSPNQKSYREDVGRRVKRAPLTTLSRTEGPVEGRGTGRRGPLPGHGELPIEADPDLAERLKIAQHADRVQQEIVDLERRVGQHHSSLAAEFDGVLDILAGRGYVDVAAWDLTPAGQMLSRIFHESDLLIAESLREGLLDGVDAPTLAGLVSLFVFEARSGDERPRSWFPSRAVQKRADSIGVMSEGLAVEETRHGLTVHRGPDATFFTNAYAWVAGEGFAEVIIDDDLTGGDFVRTIKQLVDLLRQIGQVAENPDTRATARSAAERAFRGIVADSSAVDS